MADSEGERKENSELVRREAVTSHTSQMARLRSESGSTASRSLQTDKDIYLKLVPRESKPVEPCKFLEMQVCPSTPEGLTGNDFDYVHNSRRRSFITSFIACVKSRVTQSVINGAKGITKAVQPMLK